MTIAKQIEQHMASLPAAKQIDMQAIHQLVLETLPGARLWFDDGRNEENKTVTNPTIGYGQYTIRYADGKTKEYFQVGISANTSGISLYILGLKDKEYLATTFGPQLGKAKVTGYCIRFKALKDIDTATLAAAIRYGAAASADN